MLGNPHDEYERASATGRDVSIAFPNNRHVNQPPAACAGLPFLFDFRAPLLSFDFLKRGLEKLIPVTADKGLDLTEWSIPPSPLFNENAGKIGLLGPQSAKDVAYVYENIRALRQNFHMLSKDHRNMPREWGSAMIGGLAAIHRVWSFFL